jgi:hypothetical protein
MDRKKMATILNGKNRILRRADIQPIAEESVVDSKPIENKSKRFLLKRRTGERDGGIIQSTDSHLPSEKVSDQVDNSKKSAQRASPAVANIKIDPRATEINNALDQCLDESIDSMARAFYVIKKDDIKVHPKSNKHVYAWSESTKLWVAVDAVETGVMIYMSPVLTNRLVGRIEILKIQILQLQQQHEAEIKCASTELKTRMLTKSGKKLCLYLGMRISFIQLTKYQCLYL